MFRSNLMPGHMLRHSTGQGGNPAYAMKYLPNFFMSHTAFEAQPGFAAKCSAVTLENAISPGRSFQDPGDFTDLSAPQTNSVMGSRY